MIVWFTVMTEPVRQFYADGRALPYLDGALPRHQGLLLSGAIQAGVQGENTNLSLQLQNRSGQCSAVFVRPPIGVTAVLFGVAKGQVVELFRGLIEQVDLGTTCQVQISA